MHRKVLHFLICLLSITLTGRAVSEPVTNTADLIRDLGSTDFQTRERAKKEILAIGDPIAPELKAVEYGPDPERAYQAREILRRIQYAIAGDASFESVRLVEQYIVSNAGQKMDVLEELGKLRAWNQLLRLFAHDKDKEFTDRHQDWVVHVAITAARSSLMEGDRAGAKNYLEMAPANRSGLLAMAAFHRSQGTWDAEMKRISSLKGPKVDEWRLALFRSAEKTDEALKLALKLGDERVAASQSLILGDPIPWMQLENDPEDRPIVKIFTELTKRRWAGVTLEPADLQPLVKAAQSGRPSVRSEAVVQLFLLGKPELVEEIFREHFPFQAFNYFESQQRIPEAFACHGLGNDPSEYPLWIEKRFSKLNQPDQKGKDLDFSLTQDLVQFAGFLEQRGKPEWFVPYYREQLAEIAARDAGKFTEILGLLLVGNNPEGGSSCVVVEAASDWAGNEPNRWRQVVRESVNKQDKVMELWDWLIELDPDAGYKSCFDSLLALLNLHRDTECLADRWMARFWEKIEQTPVGNRVPLLTRMNLLVRVRPNVTQSLKVWDAMPLEHRNQSPYAFHLEELSAAERWDEAARFFLKELKHISEAKIVQQPAIHAYAASALRRAGREKEAAIQDQLVEQLSLGHDCSLIAYGYEYGADYTRSAQWWRRALAFADPGSVDFQTAVAKNAPILLEQKKWKEAAALFEYQLHQFALKTSDVDNSLAYLRLRLSSDLARGISILKEDRVKGLSLLESCYQILPTDGSLADDFFPVLREAGLTVESKRWFMQSWQKLSKVLEIYPRCENLQNTMGWLASRAQQNLEEAEKLVEFALLINPDQAAYLDTMAEIQLAMGRPKKAFDLSRRAVIFSPTDSLLRKQHERFRVASLVTPDRR